MKSFKTFRLDTTNHLLWRNGDRVPVPPKGFDVLAYLVEHAGQLVTQDEILEALWPETFVNPEVLRKYILEIRRTLGDRPDTPEFIETLPKRGYRFIAPVREENAVDAPSFPTLDLTSEPSIKEPFLQKGQKRRLEPTRLLQHRKIPLINAGYGSSQSYHSSY